MYLSLLFVLFIPVFYFKFITPNTEYRLIFLRIFLIVEFSLISLIFYYNIKRIFFKKITLYLIFPFILFSGYDYFITEKATFSYVPLVVECLILLVYILYFFYEKVQTYTTIPIYQNKIFWIGVAFTIYCAGNFFLFLYANNVTKNAEFLYYYTLIYSTFTILKNILLSIGIIIKQPDFNAKDPDFLTQDSILDMIDKK